MRIADLSTVELQRLGRAAIRAYLDATAGRQGFEVLRPWVAGHEAEGPVAVAPVHHAGLGPVIVMRQGPDRAYTACTVTGRDAAGSETQYHVAAELTTSDGVLRATRLGHFPAGRDAAAGERWVAEPDPPEHLTRLLGPLPATEQGWRSWVTAAAVVADYREAWGVDDDRSALGPMPPEAEQRDERQRAVGVIRELVRAMDRAEPARHDPGRQAPGLDLTR